MMRFLTTFALCVLCLAAGVATADESSSSPSSEELIARILELKRQIEELIAALPPELQDEVRQRMDEISAPSPPAAPSPGSGHPGSGHPAPPPAVPVPPPPRPAPSVSPAPSPAPPPPALPPPADSAPVPSAPADSAPVPSAPADPAPVPSAPADPAPAVTAPSVEERPKATAPRPLRRTRRECNTLWELDSNQDGRINAQDRYWRHLYLWTDRNRDQQLQDGEVVSLYERGVREIALSLATFIRKKGTLGEIRIEDYVVFDVRGDGFGPTLSGDGVLAVNATALKRGSGPEILSPAGESLEGFHPFRKGSRIRDSAGQVTVLSCP